MKEIAKIFLQDLRRVRRSVVATIMIIGLCILPCLYAWMNIMSNFDPYSEDATSRMKIAVVSLDEGSERYGLNMNIGDTVIDNLKSNRTLGWEFPDTEEEGLEGVSSGAYYAAMVIPADFSQRITSFLDGKVDSPSILYYENEKKNIIASKITDKAMTTVEEEINGVFVSTLFGGLGDGSTIAKNAGLDLDDLYDRIDTQLTSFEADLAAMVQLTQSSDGLIDAAGGLIGSTQNYLPQVQALSKESQATLQDIWDRIGTDRELVDDAKDAALLCLEEAQGTLDALDTWVTAELDAAQDTAALSETALSHVQDTVDSLSKLLLNLDDFVSQYIPGETRRDNQLADAQKMVEQLKTTLTPLFAFEMQDRYTKGDLAGYQAAAGQAQSASDAAGDMITQLGAVKEAIEDLDDQLETFHTAVKNTQSTLTTTIASTTEDVKKLKDDLAELETDLLKDLDDCRTSVSNLQEDLGNGEELDTILGGIQDNLTTAISILGHTDGTFDQAQAALSQYSTALTACAGNIDETHQVLLNIQSVITDIHTQLQSWKADGALSELFDWLSEDPENLTDFMQSPVDFETTSVYPVENYGSAMAPFYTILSLWVGALLTAAFLRARVSSSGIKSLRTYQEFFGRMLTFLAIGQIQALLTVLGNLFYIGIQCQHPFRFWLACSVCSFAFGIVNYALAYAFSTIGEGISVLVMLVQVAGSGGTYPTEVLPQVFQTINRFLPFRHGMSAMRDSIAGLYGNTYWVGIRNVLIFGLVFIPIGLLGKLLFNWFFVLLAKAKKKTGIMA